MSFKLTVTKDKTAVSAVVEKGLEVTLNGLEVVLDENVHFTIKNATTVDQAAEICSIQKVPVDFSHFDEEKGVNVRYNAHGERIETEPVEEPAVEEPKETKAQEKARLKVEKEAADKEAGEAAADAEASAKAEAEAAEAAKKAEEEAAKTDAK